MNEELTAEEWKRRYERERDKNMRLKNSLAAMAAELVRWRQGEKVSVDEQQQPSADLSAIANLGGGDAAMVQASGISPSHSLMSMLSGSTLSLAPSTGSGPNTEGAAPRYTSSASEEELAKLYAQMDEKVCNQFLIFMLVCWLVALCLKIF